MLAGVPGHDAVVAGALVGAAVLAGAVATTGFGAATTGLGAVATGAATTGLGAEASVLALLKAFTFDQV